MLSVPPNCQDAEAAIDHPHPVQSLGHGEKWRLEPHRAEFEPKSHLADPAEDGGGQNRVLQAGEDIAQAALQRVRRHYDRGARVVKGEHGDVARGACQRLGRLVQVERAGWVGRAPSGDRLVAPGDEVEVMRACRAEPSLEFADPDLHGVIVGLHAFGEEALGFGRRGQQFGERPEADAAGKGDQSRLAVVDQALRRRVPRILACQERIFESAVGGHEFVGDRVIDAGGSAQAHRVPRVLPDMDVFLGEDMRAKPLLPVALGEPRGDHHPA